MEKFLPGEKIFLFATSDKQNQGTNQPREQKQGQNACHSTPFIPEVKKVLYHLQSPICLYSVHTDIFKYAQHAYVFKMQRNMGVSSCIHAAPVLLRIKMPRYQMNRKVNSHAASGRAAETDSSWPCVTQNSSFRNSLCNGFSKYSYRD
jgi:hypothetical protein